ncbi:MAG: thioesterase family protein [Rhizobiaceae bacterium]
MTYDRNDVDLTDFHTVRLNRVTSAECDDNGHLNVQHYVGRFANAARLVSGQHQTVYCEARVQDMHIRFHRELLSGAETYVHLGIVGKGPYAGRILHLLTADDTASPCATALDMSDTAIAGLPTIDRPAPEYAVPRSLPIEAYRTIDTDELLHKELGIIGASQVVKAADCDETDAMAASPMVGHFFRAAMRLWRFAGFERNWFGDNGYGGVAVEMKLTRFAEIQAGRSFAIVSWVPRLTNNLLDLANQMVEMPSGKPVARICAASMIFDRKTRRPVDFPQTVRDYHARQFDGIELIDTEVTDTVREIRPRPL